ncbi:Protein natd1 [Bulinus truncatus]|nr:Protein natd1 [Bulinus truncatus]
MAKSSCRRHLSRHRVSKSYNNIYVIWIDSRPLALRSNSQPERFFGTKAGGRGMDAIIGHIFINKAKLNILHNKEDNYFYIILADSSSKEKEMAKLQYDWVKPGLADLFHTEVPEEYQSQGIAKQLVLAGLDAICKDDIIIRPTCTYVRKVIQESQVQQHLDHIEKGFNL